MPSMEQINAHLKADTGRLAATYLAIIFGLTIVFSSVIYSISSSQFDRPLSSHSQSGNFWKFDDSTRGSLQDLFDERADQARGELLASLLFLNLAVLAGGAVFSYFLARKTLEPIEAAMQSQAQFVSDASHELRTPLTALQVTNEVALRKKKLTLPQATELIGYNLAETIKLRNMTEALLGLAKQESSHVQHGNVELSSLVANAVRTIGPLAAEKSITITSSVKDIAVLGDSAAITQIMTILLDNAVKYSPEGSKVKLDGSLSDSTATLTVGDNGPGITPEHQAKIFDRFYRVDESRSSQNVEGSGLGLAIAKAIADKQGYDIAVQSTPGAGSVFTLTIS